MYREPLSPSAYLHCTVSLTRFFKLSTTFSLPFFHLSAYSPPHMFISSLLLFYKSHVSSLLLHPITTLASSSPKHTTPISDDLPLHQLFSPSRSPPIPPLQSSIYPQPHNLVPLHHPSTHTPLLHTPSPSYSRAYCFTNFPVHVFIYLPLLFYVPASDCFYLSQ